MSDGVVVVVVLTDHYGEIASWYLSADLATVPFVSASSSRVDIAGWANRAECAGYIAAARAAHETLKAGGSVRHLATHDRSRWTKELRPIRRDPSRTDGPETAA